MANDRLTIFDTTLRDGEQAPGFSLRIDEKLKMARQLASLGVDVIEAGFPIASEADAEAVRLIASSVDGPVIAALARCHPADIERAGTALTPAPRAPHPHLHRHIRPAPRAQAPHDARGVSRRGGRGRAPGAQVHRRRAVFRRGRDAQRSRLPLPRRRGGHRRRLHDRQPAGHGRVLGIPHEIAAFFTAILTRVPNAAKATFSTHCHDDLGLAVANTPRRGHCRRAPGGVHDQRGRRARRQRLARGSRDGDAGAIGLAAVRHRHQHARDLSVEPVAHGAHRRGGAGQQGDRRPQCVRARSRHPPGRHAEGSPHLRDHAPRGSGRHAGDARDRQALGPARGAAPLRADRHHARARPARSASTKRSSRTPIARRRSAIGISPRSWLRSAAVPAARRAPMPGTISTRRRTRAATGTGSSR